MTGQLKQGPSRQVYEPKREPINHPISPGAVSRLGNLVGEGTPYKTLRRDDGSLKAPMHSVKTSNSGSQGKY